MRQYSSTHPSQPHLHHETSGVISRACTLWHNLEEHVLASRKHHSEANKDAHKVCGREHMQRVDCYEGGMSLSRRSGRVDGQIPESTANVVHRSESEDLIEIRPKVDGRLMDIRRGVDSRK